METRNEKMSFERLFKPKNVLIFDAKPKISFFVDGFIRQGYNLENLYLVSTKIEELLGIKCVKSLDDVPVDSIVSESALLN